MTTVLDLVNTWNPPRTKFGDVLVEDDIRDGIQGPFVTKPDVEERIELLKLSARVGTQFLVIGYPATSDQEEQECLQLVRAIEGGELSVVPKCLARSYVPDLESVVRLNEQSSVAVWSELFFGASPLRRKVENWDISEHYKRLAEAGAYLVKNNVRFGVSIEDATRTPPDELRTAVRATLDAGASHVSVCDTVGEAHPEGAKRIVEFVVEELSRQSRKVGLIWHGHNDKGVAVANALAAVEAGANIVSGAFLGLGERAGNTALEQIILHLYLAGSTRYHVKEIAPLVARLSTATGTPIPVTAPLVGKQVFATSAGTHAAAVLKARALGTDYEDYVFSGVPATQFGSRQSVMLGPTSGLSNARHLLSVLGVEGDDQLPKKLLTFAKQLDHAMSLDEVRAFVASTSKP